MLSFNLQHVLFSAIYALIWSLQEKSKWIARRVHLIKQQIIKAWQLTSNPIKNPITQLQLIKKQLIHKNKNKKWAFFLKNK
jgi:hypothetical protein